MSATPHGTLEVVFSFDTTGSMYNWLEQVRGRVQDIIQRLQTDIPGIRFAVLAHGDYCDTDIYVTKWIDFTTDVTQLCQFVQNAEQTAGGDEPECYELALRQIRTELSWTPGSRRVVVLIGDEVPHEPGDACNTDKLDWRQETKALALDGVTIYGVQCARNDADFFYQSISMATNGKHLRLEEMSSLLDTLMAVCYRESHDTALLANYESEVRARSSHVRLAADIDTIFAALRHQTGSPASATDHPSAKLSATTDLNLTLPKPVKKIKTIRKEIKTPSKKTSQLLNKRPANNLFARYKLKNLPLLKRENVPETNFSLRTLNWSRWYLAMSLDMPGDSTSWVKRAGRPGYRLKHLPTSKVAGTKLVEVAVQCGGARSKKYTVLSKLASPCFLTSAWPSRLLARQYGQVDRVLTAGCQVYIRYSHIGQQHRQEVTAQLKRYDYAWQHLKSRGGSRTVVRSGVVISS